MTIPCYSLKCDCQTQTGISYICHQRTLRPRGILRLVSRIPGGRTEWLHIKQMLSIINDLLYLHSSSGESLNVNYWRENGKKKGSLLLSLSHTQTQTAQ